MSNIILTLKVKGRNEGVLSSEGNTKTDDTPDLQTENVFVKNTFDASLQWTLWFVNF